MLQHFMTWFHYITMASNQGHPRRKKTARRAVAAIEPPYPLLYNLQSQGLIRPRWQEADSGRRRKYYSLTAKRWKRLAHDTAQWRAVTAAMQTLGILPKPVPGLGGGVA